MVIVAAGVGVAAGHPITDPPMPAASIASQSLPLRGDMPSPHRRVIIHAAGDTNFAPNLTPVFLEQGYDVAWSGLSGLFATDDLTIVNLECAPTEFGTPLEKWWAFRCPLAALQPMLEAGVEVTNLANNHAGDMGEETVVDVRSNLAEAGFLPIGAGADLDEANRPAIVEIGGWTVAVVGASNVGGGGRFASPQNPGVAPLTTENIAASVAAAAAQADVVIATVHWGFEGATAPTPADRDLARLMIEAGADAIVGHHPHILQALETIDGVPVFWSLGNFVWVRHSVPARNTTAVAEIVIEANGTITGRLIPVEIVSDGHPVLQVTPVRRVSHQLID